MNEEEKLLDLEQRVTALERSQASAAAKAKAIIEAAKIGNPIQILKVLSDL